MMVVCICRYFVSGSYNYSKAIKAVVVATSKSSAMGMVLMEYPETDAVNWDIEQVSTEIESILEIYEHTTN